MDVEMKSKNYTYFSERSYTGKDCKIDDKVVDYWKKVLGDNVFNNIEKVYNLRPEIVMSKKDFENVTESKEILQFSELFQTGFGENVKYQLKIGEKGAFVFDRFLDHFIKFGIAVLNEQEIDECIMDSYIDNIIRQISKISMGTLMFEMYICREQGLLVGNNSNEEYVYYNTHFLGDKKYINELFEIYPCLERMIFESIFYLVNNYKELLIRLKKDHDYLVEQLCDRKKFKKVVKMQSDISDSHKRGKTVSVLTLDNDVKVVYKPRSLKGEKAYQDFQTYISQGSKLKARTFKVIDCGNYGWEEFVESKPCSDMQQLRNYYYRFGELILQNYILNANDLHEENVIAYGEYPIVIDAETILDNHIELSKQNSREIINEKIRDSVLFSGLLPNYRFSNKGKGIDMSAIMGKEGDEYPILIPRIAEIGTSNMHYEYVHPIKTANNNLATLNGKFIAPATFIKEIDQGFRDAYRFIMEHKQSTIEKMKIFENIIVRHLIQDTQRYSMILHTSYHPDFLQDGKDRELVLCSIMGHIDEVEKSNKVAELEIKDMLHMDVPYFYINTSCNSLFGTDNKEISNYFETSSICKVKEKICGMTIGAMEEQSRFLKIALTDLNDYKITRKNGNIIRNNISGTFDMRRKQDAIERLAENLLHDAVITPDKHDVNWIGVSSVGSDENSTWQIQPLGNYLYEGLAGIAIFFHALCQSLKIEKYKFVCDALDQNLFTYTKEMEQKVEGIENESSGILCGEAALVYTYEILYQITKHKIYLEYARRHCEILKKTIDNDMYYDLVYGNAGAILALLNLYDLTGEIFKIDISFFEGHASGDIQNRFNSVSEIYQFISITLISAIINAVTAIMCALVMMLQSFYLFQILFIIAAAQILIVYFLNKRARIKIKNYIADQSELQGKMVEILTNIQQIRCMRIDTILCKNIKGDYQHLIQRLKEKAQISDFIETIATTFTTISPMLLYTMGGFLIINSNLELGALVSFITLSTYFTGPFQTLSLIIPQISVLRETMLRINELMNYSDEIQSGKQSIGRFESISLKNVTFKYLGSNEPDLKGINITIKRGEKIAIVGESGSGKTTISKLLLNALTKYEGEILLNGYNINSIKREAIDHIFTIVTQVPMAISGTIRDNIDISHDLSDDEIYSCLKTAELENDVNKFPMKLNTFVGENGQNISGGQKQRIAIARALALKPEVLILDEATSNLDPITERKICDNLKKLHITQIIITHRLSQVEDADMIYVLNHGEIMEKGSHEQLMKGKGLYSKLVRIA